MRIEMNFIDNSVGGMLRFTSNWNIRSSFGHPNMIEGVALRYSLIYSYLCSFVMSNIFRMICPCAERRRPMIKAVRKRGRVTKRKTKTKIMVHTRTHNGNANRNVT